MPQPLTQLLRKAVRIGAPEEVPAPATNKPWLAADNAAGNAWTIDDHGVTRRFFFITGCSKSGTHWVQNLLNLHPSVCVKGEFHFEHLRDGYHKIVEHHYYPSARPHLRPIADEAYHTMVRRLMLAAAQSKPQATWIADRSPRLLSEILPGAPTIHIRRDGRDVMVSWNFHHMRVEKQEYVDESVQSAVAAIGAEYRANPGRFNAPGSGLLASESWFRRQARVWASNIEHELAEAPRLLDRGVSLIQLRYETLHADVARARRELYEFLALDETPAAPISDESRTTPGFDGSGPLEFYRKGAVGEWRTLFTDTQKRWFKDEAGEALIRAGYEKDANW